MANVTRIKAHDPRKKREETAPEPPRAPQKDAKKKVVPTTAADKKSLKAAKKAAKQAKKAEKPKKPMGKFKRFITWPFRYVHESWLELRQVRWPSRGTAWKMVGAVLAYTALFIIIIMLLDALFTWLFNLLIG